MQKTTLSIMGHAVVIQYTVFEGGYIDWQSGLNDSLLNTLLRIHYNDYICAELRKTWFQEEYERHEIHSAQLSLGIEDGNVF